MALGRYGSPEAVVLDLSGVAAMFQQQQQQRKLNQQLVDKQVNEDLSKLSLDGVRPQDYQVIRQKYDQYKDAAINYKKALRDPRTRDQAEQSYINSKTDLSTAIGRSKSRKETAKGVIDFWGKNRDQIDADAFAKTKALIDAPLGSKEFDEADNIDISNLVFKPEKYDPKKIADLVGSIKPVENNVTTQLPNGQFSYSKSKVLPAGTISAIVGQAYDTDYENTKKYYDTQFQTLPEEDRAIYEDYAKRYIPDFSIQSPKDLAIAENMYGRVELGLDKGIKGRDVSRAENFQRAQQARQIAATDRRQERLIKSQQDKKANGDYYVVDDIAQNLRVGNVKNALAPFESYASPGTLVTFVKSGQTDEGVLDRVYNDIQRDGVDSKTRMISKSMFKNGAVIVAVPKVDAETKEVIKGQYEYMAVPSGERNLESRINAMLNYARGGTNKPLPDKFYKGRIEPTVEDAVTPGYLDDADPETEEESQ
jgi:hypothetical protein